MCFTPASLPLQSELSSFLVEITSIILSKKDDQVCGQLHSCPPAALSQVVAAGSPDNILLSFGKDLRPWRECFSHLKLSQQVLLAFCLWSHHPANLHC
jgi:hypothetical protein